MKKGLSRNHFKKNCFFYIWYKLGIKPEFPDKGKMFEGHY